MARVSGLKYVGRAPTPSGVIRFWDSGKMASPVELAEVMGFQTALVAARNSRERGKVKKAMWTWMEGFMESINIWSPGVTCTIAEDGRVFVSSPEYDDEKPA